MLILTRRVTESLIIGDNIKVTILGVKGNQVRCGIQTDKDVPIHREEIYNRLMREEGKAVSFAGKNKSSQVRFCDCCGYLAPGLTCKWANPNDNEICSYKGDEHCEHME